MEAYENDPKVLRIREVYKELNFRSKGSFAKEISESPQNVGNYMSGKRLPRREFIERVHQRFPQYNLRWLLDGVGEKYDPKYVEIRGNGNVIANNNNGGDNIIGDKDLCQQFIDSLRKQIDMLERYNEHLLAENERLSKMIDKLTNG